MILLQLCVLEIVVFKFVSTSYTVLLSELPTMLNMFDVNYQLHYSESYTGTVHQETTIQGYQSCFSLQRAYESLISEDYKNFILTVRCITVAINVKVKWDLKYLILMQEIYMIEDILKVFVCFQKYHH